MNDDKCPKCGARINITITSVRRSMLPKGAEAENFFVWKCGRSAAVPDKDTVDCLRRQLARSEQKRAALREALANTLPLAECGVVFNKDMHSLPDHAKAALKALNEAKAALKADEEKP